MSIFEEIISFYKKYYKNNAYELFQIICEIILLNHSINETFKNGIKNKLLEFSDMVPVIATYNNKIYYTNCKIIENLILQ